MATDCPTVQCKTLAQNGMSEPRRAGSPPIEAAVTGKDTLKCTLHLVGTTTAFECELCCAFEFTAVTT